MAVKNVDATNFEAEVLKSDKPVLVDLYADWCGPCKAFAPVIEAISEEVAGKYKVCKLNIDDSHDIAASLKVRSVPTLIVFKDGAPYKVQVGRTTKEAVLKLFE